MRQLIFMTLQLPDLSFENMKSLGAIGYDARQMLLSDAHLKVNRESGTIIEMLEREASVIKTFLALMNAAWATAIDDITIEHTITPYIQNDEEAEIDKRIKANGGKPIESQSREHSEIWGKRQPRGDTSTDTARGGRCCRARS